MAASNQEKVLVLAFSVIAYERSCGPSFPALFCTHCNISIPGTGISGGVAGGHPGAGGGRHQGRGRGQCQVVGGAGAGHVRARHRSHEQAA